MGQICSLTFKEAEKIMAAALQTLRAQFKSASVSIVNRDGTEIAKAVMDGIKPFTKNVAFLKARQAVWVGKSTRETRDEIRDKKKTPELLGIEPACFVPWAGGMPIYDVKSRLIGGIGVSNLDEMEDEMVAENSVCRVGFKVHI